MQGRVRVRVREIGLGLRVGFGLRVRVGAEGSCDMVYMITGIRLRSHERHMGVPHGGTDTTWGYHAEVHGGTTQRYMGLCGVTAVMGPIWRHMGVPHGGTRGYGRMRGIWGYHMEVHGGTDTCFRYTVNTYVRI